MKKKRIAVVTGASSGMGREFVLQIPKYCKSLDEIWVIARRAERLEKLAKESSVKIVPIIIDLQNQTDYKIYEEKLKNENPDIRILVNSAGYGVHGYFEEQDEKEALGMIELNCHALTKITYMSLKFMHTNSRIINMASAAAFFPQKRFAVYSASKSYVLDFSRALNVELKDRKVYVTAVCPGPVDTEFFKKDNCDIRQTFYKKIVMAKPENVVKQALYDSVHKREISAYGRLIKAFHVVTQIIPSKIILFVTRYIL